MRVRRPRSAFLALWFVALLLSTTAAAATRLTEAGSTLLYPLMSVWVAKYMALNPGVDVSALPTGSSAGVAAAIDGEVQIGASDAYLTDAQLRTGLINIPLAVSAQEIDYNVPELHGSEALRLSGPTLAGIYDGSIEMWDDARIRTINPERPLPHHVIVPIHRSEGSGDTFLFTSYLSLSTPAWNDRVRFGNRIEWPNVGRALEARGNAGMIDICQSVPYSVTYVGISYANRARASGLDAALLQNRAGSYVSPTPETIHSALDAAGSVAADGRVSLIFTSGANSYPLVNFEYAVVKQRQTTPEAAQTLRDFLTWAIGASGGNDPNVLADFHFVPLPSQVRSIAQRQIGSISGP